MGVIIGWVFALRAQAREKILDARDSICSLAEMLLEENPEELDKIGEEAYFERPKFATWRKSKWDSTAVICNTETKKAKVSFFFSRTKLVSEAADEAFTSISSTLALDAQTKKAIENFAAQLSKSEEGKRRFCVKGNLGDSTVVLLFVVFKA